MDEFFAAMNSLSDEILGFQDQHAAGLGIRYVFQLGDEGWIRSASSLRYLREEVKRGDLFLCYEVDRKRMLGLACAASDGRDIGAGSLLDFCPPHEAVRLKNPLKRHPDLDHI